MQVATKVQLCFSCANLEDKDVVSKSDPFLVLYAKQANGQLRPLGRTETVDNNLNPTFKTTVTVDYLFEVKQTMVVRVYDDDGHRTESQNDFLGEVEFPLAHVMCARNHTKTFNFASNKGTVTIAGTDQATSGEDTIMLQFSGSHMKKMDLFSKSDPYFTLNRILPNGERKLLYKSEAIEDSSDPHWRPLPVMKVFDVMGASSADKTLDLLCFDKNSVLSDSPMGHVCLSVDELVTASRDANASFSLMGEKSKHFGNIHVRKCEIHRGITFADLLARGWQLNLAVAIDFTGSNGDPKNPKSLHYMSGGPNQYVKALTAVGEILVDYDTDKQIVAFGYGAKLPDGRVSHNFHLNLEPNPYVHGVEGALAAYSRALSAVSLNGPTNFCPVIEAVVAGARQAEASQVYTFLLIITDGEISDLDSTIDSLVRADDAPVSIVIVGVGNDCDFAGMKQLDGDEVRLSSRGRTSRRDLVQFVAMREFANRSPMELAAEVLREVPAQIEQWAKLKGMKKDDPVPPAESGMV